MDWLYYVYTTILKRTESEFWHSTLRKVVSQISIHNNLYKNEKQEKVSEDTEVLKVLG